MPNTKLQSFCKLSRLEVKTGSGIHRLAPNVPEEKIQSLKAQKPIVSNKIAFSFSKLEKEKYKQKNN